MIHIKTLSIFKCHYRADCVGDIADTKALNFRRLALFDSEERDHALDPGRKLVD